MIYFMNIYIFLIDEKNDSLKMDKCKIYIMREIIF